MSDDPMDQRSEFAEPWKAENGILHNRVGMRIPELFDDALDEFYAIRVAACVNFLAGVPTEMLNLISTRKPDYAEKVRFQLGCVGLAIERGLIGNEAENK